MVPTLFRELRIEIEWKWLNSFANKEEMVGWEGSEVSG
jgi:hypothetical protein